MQNDMAKLFIKKESLLQSNSPLTRKPLLADALYLYQDKIWGFIGIIKVRVVRKHFAVLHKIRQHFIFYYINSILEQEGRNNTQKPIHLAPMQFI